MSLLTMVRHLLVGVFATILAAGWFVQPLSAQDPSAESIAARESAHRHAAISDALQQVQKARTAYADKRYSDAVDHYRNALSVLPEAPATKKQREFIRVSLADALIARAIDYRSVGRTEEAISFLKEAVQLDPSGTRAKKELVYTEDPVRNNPALTPRHVGDVEEVNRLLTLAYGYYDLGNYDQALKTFQSVLRIDETNEAARRGMEAVNNRRASFYNTAYDATRAAKLAEVDRTWDDAQKVEMQPTPPIATGSANPAPQGQDEAQDPELSYVKLLESTIVPSIHVDDADITEVIEILRGIVRRAQAQAPVAQQRPINVVSNFGGPSTPGYKQIMQRRRSFRLDQCSMKDVLSEISQLYEVDYYYVPMGIEFTYAGQNYGRLVDRVFYVPPHFFDEQEDSEAGSDDEEVDGFGARKVRVSRIDPEAALKKMNISFPEGASARYRPVTRRLAVRNTQRNIAQIEELLADVAPVEDKLVVLTVKVVETTQEDLEDLGFEWLLGVDAGSKLFAGGGTDQVVSTAAGMPIITPTYQNTDDMPPAVTHGQRSIRQVVGQRNLDNLIKRGQVRNYLSETSTEGLSPTIFGLRGVWSTVDVTMVMRGLAQNRAIDSLSSPKLVLNAGSEEQASFVDVRELYYPSSYDEPRIAESMDQPVEGRPGDSTDYNKDGVIEPVPTPVYVGATAVAVGAQPTDFVLYGMDEDNVGGIGTIVQVHNAEISPDGNNVKLAITTIVNDFEGFLDWGSSIYAALPTDKTVETIKLTDNQIYQPLFKRYMTNSVVTIQDGAVLVMGGMKESKIVRYEDKVPVLGDLPLVGRLFRSSGTDKKNRALLIFAKVNIVDPTGNNIHQTSQEATVQNPA